MALSVASPRLAVSEHAARRSSDFPPQAPRWEHRAIAWSTPAQGLFYRALSERHPEALKSSAAAFQALGLSAKNRADDL